MVKSLKKLLLTLILLLASGCSLIGGRDIPEVAPVEVVTIQKQAPVYHPPLPSPIQTVPVEWTILTPDRMEEYIEDLKKGEAPANVWYSLTTKGYENLSSNMAEIKRYLRQILSITNYYQEFDKQETKEDEPID